MLSWQRKRVLCFTETSVHTGKNASQAWDLLKTWMLDVQTSPVAMVLRCSGACPGCGFLHPWLHAELSAVISLQTFLLLFWEIIYFFSIKMYSRILITTQVTDPKPLFYALIIPSTFNNQRKGLTFYSFNASIRCSVVCLCRWLAPDLWLTCSPDSGSRECQSWWASRAWTWDGQRPSL